MSHQRQMERRGKQTPQNVILRKYRKEDGLMPDYPEGVGVAVPA